MHGFSDKISVKMSAWPTIVLLLAISEFKLAQIPHFYSRQTLALLDISVSARILHPHSHPLLEQQEPKQQHKLTRQLSCFAFANSRLSFSGNFHKATVPHRRGAFIHPNSTTACEIGSEASRNKKGMAFMFSIISRN